MGRKLWEKEKLLITSNFSFSHSVFKGLVLQTRKIQGFIRKGLKIAIQGYKTLCNISSKLLQDTPLLPQVVTIHEIS